MSKLFLLVVVAYFWGIPAEAQTERISTRSQVSFGAGTSSDKTLFFDVGAATNPAIRYNNSTGELEFAHDGTNFLGLDGTKLEVTIADNQSSAADVTGLVFDKATYKAAVVLFDIHRRTDAESANEIGELFLSHDTEADVWRIGFDSKGDDSGVSFSITAAGQVQYTSSSMAGASYSGVLRAKILSRIEQ